MLVTVAPVDAKTARYAVEQWHYSHAMPAGRATKVGVWEDGRFVGVVIFSRGASPHLGRAYDLTTYQLCELTRVALRDHQAPVSQIVVEAIRLLRQVTPGLRLLVSFADPYRDHHGGIYQAMNWLYLGTTAPTDAWLDPGGGAHHARTVMAGGFQPGRLLHNRAIDHGGGVKQFGRASLGAARAEDCVKIKMPGKHKYVVPLDRQIRRRLLPLALPYPKREEPATPGDAAGSIELPGG